jgi:hypothetical protein
MGTSPERTKRSLREDAEFDMDEWPESTQRD